MARDCRSESVSLVGLTAEESDALRMIGGSCDQLQKQLPERMKTAVRVELQEFELTEGCYDRKRHCPLHDMK